MKCKAAVVAGERFSLKGTIMLRKAIVGLLLCVGVACADPPLVDVELHPPYSWTTAQGYVYYEVTLTADSVVPVSTVEILLEWDISPVDGSVEPDPGGTKSEDGSTIPRVPSRIAQTVELVDVVPLGTWFAAGFLPDPDGINGDVTDGQALYTLLAPIGWPVGQPVATPNGTPVLRLKFKVRGAGGVEIVPAVGEYGRTRVLEYGVPNHDVTGTNEDVSTTNICCGC